jgi:hypothetical protein
MRNSIQTNTDRAYDYDSILQDTNKIYAKNGMDAFVSRTPDVSLSEPRTNFRWAFLKKMKNLIPSIFFIANTIFDESTNCIVVLKQTPFISIRHCRNVVVRQQSI